MATEFSDNKIKNITENEEIKQLKIP